jgi:tetratricopeptide (TPR) repeat protein
LENKGDHDRAIDDYSAAIRLDSKLDAAFHGRGNAWSGKGEYDRAIVDYSDAIRLDPKYAGSYRGNAWENKGDHDRAITDYNEAIRLDPKNPDRYVSRGIAWENPKPLAFPASAPP